MGHLVFAVLTTIVSILITAGAVYGATMQRLDDVERRTGSVERIQSDVQEIKTNVQWLMRQHGYTP
ncbi:MAG TPA: hypothetical protein VNI20_05750 [Fimbriimonadaceae bacterium]|nr:hypothetical protein [Fimbriimonadaceae bacterium]